MTAATATTVQYLNLAYFGRPADSASLTAFPATGMTDEQIVASFVNTSEYVTNTVTPNSSTNPDGSSTVNQTNLINTFYLRLFGRLAASVEVTGWTTALAQGTVNEDYLGITIMRAALNLDASTEMRQVMVAKFDSAQLFSDNLAADPASAQAYSTSAAITSAASYLSGITTTTAATATEAATAVTAMVGTTDAQGTNFALTTDVDVFTGTGLNDVFTATVSGSSETLNALDDINGAGGSDVLNYTTVGGAALTGKLTSIETINVVSDGDIVASTVSTDVTGVTAITGRTAEAFAAAGPDANIDTNGDVTSVVLNGPNLQSINIDDNATTDVLASVSITGVADDGGTGTDDILIASTALTTLSATNVHSEDDGDDINTDATGTLTVNLNNVDLNAGDLLASAATGAVINTAGSDAIDIHTVDVDAATALTINANATATAGTLFDALDAASATSITVTGAGDLTVTAGTYTALTSIDASAATGDVTFTQALAAADAFAGGSGADSIEIGASTVANTMGAGNDSVTITAGVTALGTGGSIDAGAGDTDTLTMAIADSITATASTAFNADIANFERLSLGAYADTGTTASTISLANADNINHVTSAGIVSQSAASTITISGFQEAGTFRQTALISTIGNFTLTGAFTGASDSFTLEAASTNGFANIGVLTLAAIETLNISLDDTDTTAASTMFDLNLDAAAAQTINVTGDAGITFANSTQAAIRTLDASGVTATGAAGVVTFTANDSMDTTITAAGGNDVLTGGSGNDTITGNAGNDTLTGGSGVDTISGGTGNDVIDGGVGADVITTGTGTDSVVIGSASSLGTMDIVTDFTAGTGGDQIDIDETNFGALVGGDGADDADTVAVSIKEVGGQTTLAAGNNVVVLVGAQYASNVAMEAAINSGGDRQITFGSATGSANDDLVVVWTNTSGNTIVSGVNITTAATTIGTDATVADLLQLTGVDSSVSGTLVNANFDLI
jgi:S-layer protein